MGYCGTPHALCRWPLTDGEAAKLLTYDGVQQADVVITRGCGETCPVFPGRTYEDWQDRARSHR